MTKIHSRALGETVEVDRVIGHLKGSKPGPTVIFTGGIHGNEPSGVFALDKVFKALKSAEGDMAGECIALSGNLWALQRNERFHKEDLNRIWTSERLKTLNSERAQNEDMLEQREIHAHISKILESGKGPYYFMDLHTTSSETIPFLTVNDSLLNRTFTEQYPVPMILGIEEYLDGPLLSLINELGYVAFGFEAGKHEELKSIDNHESFIYLSLVFAGVLPEDHSSFQLHYDRLKEQVGGKRSIFEIYFRYKIKPEEKFEMKPGFTNFQTIQKGSQLATSDGEPIIANHTAQVFMPLYQKQGEDGFFAIKVISPFYLKLSAYLRKWRSDRLLAWLPGVNWSSDRRDELMVNKRIARFFTRNFFHLMGYRSKRLDKTHLIAKNREAKSRYKEYIGSPWFKPMV